MGTNIRAEISGKNKYYIGKHRHYELKHFCLQYPIWKKLYFSLNSIQQRPIGEIDYIVKGRHSDPTVRCAEAMIFFKEKMDMIEKAARDTDNELSDYILIGVTEGVSYTYLKSKLEIPCCKDKYYELYRKFFWLLSKERQ